ncbi:MAG: glycosyltransferase [Chthoniobacterales bacterium]
MKVSVVTPSYRQLEYLQLCAASVADQTGVEVEHIIQDAGTGPELERWAAAQPNLRLFVEADSGMYDAVNRGLRRATGEICAYLNCDEQYLPGVLARVAEFFQSRPEVDVLFGDLILVNKFGEPLSYRRTVLPTKRHVRLAHLNTATCAMFFRRKLLDQGHYFDVRWKAIGDAVWIERLLQDNFRLATLPEPLAVFTMTGENLGSTGISLEEGRTWKSGGGPEKVLERLAAIIWHRLRKWKVGAYRRRRVEINIFTRQSPEKRQRIVREGVGFRWPANELASN